MTIDTGLALEEYRALRATIRERSTMRLLVALITFVAWAALAVLATGLGFARPLTLIPLIVLAAGFETVYAAHVAVERVGRYLQVHYETAPGQPPEWEHAAMGIGRPTRPSSGADPLYCTLFILAIVLNLMPAAVAPSTGESDFLGISMELAALTIFHLLVIGRILRARSFAAGQRSRDLQWFRQQPTARPER
jgi:hypothetical protein